MYGILFRVEANPGKFQELVDFLTWDARVSRDEEPGTLRFEFFQDPDDDNALYVYEAYQNLDAFEARKQNEPYRRFASGLRNELGTNYSILFSGEALFSPAVLSLKPRTQTWPHRAIFSR
jgi:quinol monooxygenase YgiN